MAGEARKTVARRSHRRGEGALEEGIRLYETKGILPAVERTRASFPAHRVSCPRKEVRMGWLDNLWRRPQGRATETPEDTVKARASEGEKLSEQEEADLLEEDAHRFRDEEIFREPRIPPGTG